MDLFRGCKFKKFSDSMSKVKQGRNENLEDKFTNT